MNSIMKWSKGQNPRAVVQDCSLDSGSTEQSNHSTSILMYYRLYLRRLTILMFFAFPSCEWQTIGQGGGCLQPNARPAHKLLLASLQHQLESSLKPPRTARTLANLRQYQSWNYVKLCETGFFSSFITSVLSFSIHSQGIPKQVGGDAA